MFCYISLGWCSRYGQPGQQQKPGQSEDQAGKWYPGYPGVPGGGFPGAPGGSFPGAPGAGNTFYKQSYSTIMRICPYFTVKIASLFSTAHSS